MTISLSTSRIQLRLPARRFRVPSRTPERVGLLPQGIGALSQPLQPGTIVVERTLLLRAGAR